MLRDGSAPARRKVLDLMNRAVDGPAMSEGQLTLEVLTAIDEVPAAEWDALAGDDNPFVEHAFLHALEASGSVGAGEADTGWTPLHLTLRDDRGALRGAMPLYLKTDSYGEYIFDWGWADAAMRAGLAYYPKLVCAVPFTPATGPRLLVSDDAGRDRVASALLSGARTLEQRLGCSSTHLLFCTEGEQRLAEEQGFLTRLTCQFHWDNDGYESFDDFLSTFRSSARKAVRRERRRARESGLQIELKAGHELTDDEWDAMYAFYRDTTSRKWGQAYLNRRFFELARERLPDRVLVSLAKDGDRPVAGALCFRKGAHVYGRYWGCLESYDMLHFELCYYLPIERCIAEGWRRFEAGAQGVHKLKRGLMPRPIYSAHHIDHAGLRRAVSRHLLIEGHSQQQEMKLLEQHSPFRRDAKSPPCK
jgi:predicted N-acyltransferase